jgi:hypothetical protein
MGLFVTSFTLSAKVSVLLVSRIESVSGLHAATCERNSGLKKKKFAIQEQKRARTMTVFDVPPSESLRIMVMAESR